VKQVHISNLNFRFLVKFYTPDPELLEEELTRSGCGSVYIELVVQKNNFHDALCCKITNNLFLQFYKRIIH